MPSLTGASAVVTGANSGLGLITARELARAGAHVVLAVRDSERGQRAAASIAGSTEVRRLDLADLASIRAFADSWDGPLDLLVNNAGVMAVPESRTKDGFEMQIGTNHLGHFALTNLLLPRITDRIVTVSSFSPPDGKDPPRRSQLRAGRLRALDGLWPVEARESPVHARAPAPPRRRQLGRARRRSASRLCAHEPAGAHRQRAAERAHVRHEPGDRTERRAGCAADAVRGDPGAPRRRGTSGRTDFRRCAATRRWPRAAPRRRTPRWRSGCGRSPSS